MSIKLAFQMSAAALAVSGVTHASTVSRLSMQVAPFGAPLNDEGVTRSKLPAFPAEIGTYYGVEFRVDSYDETGAYHLTSNLPDVHEGYTLDLSTAVKFSADGVTFPDIVLDVDLCQVEFDAVPGENVIDIASKCVVPSIAWMLGTNIGNGADVDYQFVGTATYDLTFPAGASFSVGSDTSAFVKGDVAVSYLYFADDQNSDGVVDFNDLLGVLSQWGEYDGHEVDVLLSVLASM